MELRQEDEMGFEAWARAKYAECVEKTRLRNDHGEICPVRINEVIVDFGTYFTWVGTLLEIVTLDLERAETRFEIWMRDKQVESKKRLALTDKGARAPSQEAILADLISTNEVDYLAHKEAIAEAKARVNLLKSFSRSLDKQAGLIQTLCNNMRSEAYYVAGVPIGSGGKTAQSVQDAEDEMKDLVGA